MGRIDDVIAVLQPPCAAAAREAGRRLDAKTKPRGSLGRLEELAVALAGMRGCADFPVPRPAVVLMASDHGVAREGVSAYPQSVTVEMLSNLARGGAAINIIARHAGAELFVIDLGSLAEKPVEGAVDRRIARGTANFTTDPAMSEEQAVRAIECGVDVAGDVVNRGHDLLAIGELGIGNTTAASALAVAFTGADPSSVTGRGCGIDPATRTHKANVVRRACALHLADGPGPLATLARLGGFELAALAGVVIGGAAHRLPVVIDGFPATAAALAAVRLAPRAAKYLIAAHLSPEPGHRLLLDALGLRPLLEFDLRLGEGTGAALALPIVGAAVKILREMATFAEAGVSDAGR